MNRGIRRFLGEPPWVGHQHYPAIMVTDTAPFRYSHYHTLDDISKNIDFERLARVVNNLVPVIEHLVAAKSPK